MNFKNNLNRTETKTSTSNSRNSDYYEPLRSETILQL